MSGIVGSRLNIKGSGLVGSLGTDGQVFTSSGAGAGAVFEDAAGGGAWTYISTTTISSAVDEVQITSGIDSTYDKYYFHISNINHDTDDKNHYLQVISGGSVVTASDYRSCHNGINSLSTSSANIVDNDHTFIYLNASGCSLEDDENIEINLYMYNPSNTATETYVQFNGIVHQHNDRIDSWYGGGVYDQTAAVTGIKYYPADGCFEGGQIRLYGLNKS